MAERGRGWVVIMPGLFVGTLERWNSPYINHFISADTVVSSYANPQTLNRYSYVSNNPLRYIDPTGHSMSMGCGDDGKAACPHGNGNTPGNAGNCSGSSCHGNGGGDDEGGSSSDDESTSNCPDWNICIPDASTETMHDYWDANNDFTDIITLGGLATDLAFTGFDYVVQQGYLTGPSLALIVSYVTVAVLDPLPIEEIATGIMAGGLVWSIIAAAGGSDIQNINDAMVETGAYDYGGSITADWDGATVIGPNGTQTVDTWIPFAAPVSLLIWSIPAPDIGMSINP